MERLDFLQRSTPNRAADFHNVIDHVTPLPSRVNTAVKPSPPKQPTANVTQRGLTASTPGLKSQLK
jgi:hypothetical protein